MIADPLLAIPAMRKARVDPMNILRDERGGAAVLAGGMVANTLTWESPDHLEPLEV